ncbi:M23 family metallopeptidase [Ideonella azotifigens]|uniref:M23 family metallopeptidase n=3 Tax=Ideonella azotifigens TaxID=513160 RepID=UPI0011420A4F|nr:M23 family metallopeptidase [Ideonella azotifigens]MCD2339299.1 M23 family metallopeptidase [Ideonella azotifigens]
MRSSHPSAHPVRTWRRRMSVVMAWSSLLLLAAAATAAEEPAPIEAHAVFTPQAVPGSDGFVHLAYELDVTNFYAGTGPLNLGLLEVFASGASKPLASFSGAALAGLLGPGKALEANNSLPIEAGMHAVLFVWLTLPKTQPLPALLRHRLVFKTAKGQTQVATDVPVAVDSTRPVVIAAPLRSNAKAVQWLVDEGPGHAQSHHWGSLVAENGRLTIPQRHAIDFFGLDAKGHAITVPSDKLASSLPGDWTGFDAEVVAVADGVVRNARDGVPDHRPLAPMEQPTEMTAEALYGNFVILEIAPHVFVHYAHLRQGSLRVKTGERIQRGTVLARLGVSGSAGAPHLHFHVASSAGFAPSQGLPFVFERFTLTGRGSEDDMLDLSKDASLDHPVGMRGVMPLHGDLIGF